MFQATFIEQRGNDFRLIAIGMLQSVRLLFCIFVHFFFFFLLLLIRLGLSEPY